MKSYSDSTMKRWTKDELIERIRNLEHNCQILQEMNDRQFKMLVERDSSAEIEMLREQND